MKTKAEQEMEFQLDGEVIRSSFEYKINLLKMAIEEWNSRRKYFYYNYDPVRPNTTKYVDFHLCGKKIRVCKGAPRSGKTVAVVWDHIAIALGEHPVYKQVVPNHGWVIGETFKKVYRTDGLMDKFLKQVPMNRVVDIQNDNKRNNFSMKFDNGSTITFLSQEAPEDFTSASIGSRYSE